jgi:hypothetical protein
MSKEKVRSLTGSWIDASGRMDATQREIDRLDRKAKRVKRDLEKALKAHKAAKEHEDHIRSLWLEAMDGVIDKDEE